MSEHCIPCLRHPSGPPRDYACFAWSNQECSRQAPGCGVGCENCEDQSCTQPPASGAGIEGRRWARPSERKRYPAPLARDAYGYLQPLRTAKTVLALPQSEWELAPVNDYYGGECFKQTFCDSTYLKKRLTQPDWLCTPDQVPGLTYTQCNLFHGEFLPTAPPDMTCRLCTDGGTAQVFVKSTIGDTVALLNHANARTGPCVTNAGVACLAKCPHSGRCCPPTFREWYVGDDQEQYLLELLDVKWRPNPDLRPHFKADPRFHRRPADVARYDAMNAVMAYIADHAADMGLGRVKKDYTSINLRLDHWGAEFNATCDDAPVIATWPDCYLRLTGCPVEVDLVLTHVNLTLSLVFHEQTNPVRNDYPIIFPSARLDITVRTATRARRLGQCRFRRFDGEVIDLDIGDDGRCNSTIEPAGTDSIIYVDAAGREFIPPRFFRWRGGRSASTETPWLNLDPLSYLSTCPDFGTRDKCCRIAAALTLQDSCDGYEVFGMPTEYEPRVGNVAVHEARGISTLVYGGSVSLAVPEFKFFDHCVLECAENMRRACR